MASSADTFDNSLIVWLNQARQRATRVLVYQRAALVISVFRLFVLIVIFVSAWWQAINLMTTLIASWLLVLQEVSAWNQAGYTQAIIWARGLDELRDDSEPPSS